jgi:hypothetical protein
LGLVIKLLLSGTGVGHSIWSPTFCYPFVVVGVGIVAGKYLMFGFWFTMFHFIRQRDVVYISVLFPQLCECGGRRFSKLKGREETEEYY